MDDAQPSESEVRELELRALVKRIKREACVLVLGPGVAIDPGDARRTPLDELVARDLLASIGPPAGPGPVSLRSASDDYYRQKNDIEELQLDVADRYRRTADSTTSFHRDLAALPFALCISVSPDNLMCSAFAGVPEKQPQRGYYNFRGRPAPPAVSPPTVKRPLVYHLFGHYDEPMSLVLTEGDLIEFLIAIVRGTPAIPDAVRSMLTPNDASFLFIGFGFQNWYHRVLLPVMNVYGQRSKGLAVEDQQFFEHPDRKQTVAFFSGDRRIDFRSLRWDQFAKQLREMYETDQAKKQPLPPAKVRPPLVGPAPKVFLSYASDDRDEVEMLAEQLQTSGIKAWQDKQELRAGDNWNRTLLDVIGRQVNYVVVVLTSRMTSRVEGVFNEEIAAALNRQKKMGELDGVPLRFLLPVKIGDCRLLSPLNHLHVIDIGEPGGLDALIDSILEDWQRRAQLANPEASHG